MIAQFRSRPWLLLIAAATCGLNHRASAQIIFEPVQYQYGVGEKFYYGGSDPGVIAYGLHLSQSGLYHPLVTIYRDDRPYENVAIYGYTTSDARNEAYANVPTYFRKRDLLAAGNRDLDGTLSTMAQAQLVIGPVMQKPVQPRVMQQPILIIPKGGVIPKLRSNNMVITTK